MRSLILGSLLIAALLLLPGAQAGTLVETEGKWYWQVRGTVNLVGLPGVDTQAVIYLAPDGGYWWRVTYDPLDRVYLECGDGLGALSVSGVALPTESCSLELSGAFAVPRAVVRTVDAGQLPGFVGDYLGPLAENLGGSGSFRLA